MAELLEPLEREAAKQRQAAAGPTKGKGKKKTGSAKCSGPVVNGRALDKVASAVGMTRPTLRKIQVIRDAAKEKPERYEVLLKELDLAGESEAEIMGWLEAVADRSA